MNTMDQQQAECFIIIKCKNFFIMYFVFFTEIDDSLPRWMDGQEDNDEREKEWKKDHVSCHIRCYSCCTLFFSCVFLPGFRMS